MRTWRDSTDGDFGHGDPDVGVVVPSAGIARRDVLLAAGIMPLAAPAFTRVRAQSPYAPPSEVVRSALHIHSSFSEGAGGMTSWGQGKVMASMESHADSLRRLGFDLCMYTDHDHRMAGENYGQVPTPYPRREDLTAPTWAYSGQHLGPGSGGHHFTDAGLEISARADDVGRRSTHLVFASCENKDWNYRATLAGTTVTVSLVAPGAGSAELWILASHRPPRDGRPEGGYSVRYRFTNELSVREIAASGNQAIVTIPVIADEVSSVSVVPVDDLREAFPDLGDLAEDNGLYGIWFGVSSDEGWASAVFSELRVERDTGLAEAIALQQRLLPLVRARHPGITLAQGLEQSYGPHLNWLATDGVTGLKPRASTEWGDYLRSCVELAHAAGGASSFNHMFGANQGPLLPGVERAKKIELVARRLLAHRLYGADLLEVGYNLRGNVDLRAHIEVWDILLAAGVRVFADGVSDNHAGTMASYALAVNTFATDILAPSSDPHIAIPALRAGRAFCSIVGRFGGRLDIVHDGVRMGSTATVTGANVPVTLIAEGLPAGSKIAVRQYGIHPNSPISMRRDPLKFIPYTPTSQDSTRTLRFPARTSYIRFEVLDRDSAIIAFSNPLFLRRA